MSFAYMYVLNGKYIYDAGNVLFMSVYCYCDCTCIHHIESHHITRMHSSRMRTARSSGRPGGTPPGSRTPWTRHPPPCCKACWDGIAHPLLQGMLGYHLQCMLG